MVVSGTSGGLGRGWLLGMIALWLLPVVSTCSFGGSDSQSETPEQSPPASVTPPPQTASPVATATEPAVPTQGPVLVVNGRAVPVTEAKLVGPSTFARNLSLVVMGSCANCRDVTIERVTWGEVGEATSETLLSPTDYGGTYLTGVAATYNGSVLVAGVCLVEDCGGFGPAFNAAARVLVLRSTDGGVTWSEIGTLSGYTQPLGVAADGQAIVQRLEAEESFVAKVPSGLRYAVPDAVAGRPDFPWVVAGQPWWKPTAAGRTLWGLDGEWTPDVPEESALVGIIPWGRGAVLYQWEGEDGSFVGDPHEDGFLRIAWRLPTATLSLAAWEYSSTSLVGVSSLDGRVVPTLVHQGPDPSELTVEPLAGPMFEAERYQVMAAAAGPFLRVVGSGSCVDVFDQPDGQSVRCFAEGVLLQDLGESMEADGEVWRKVFTPAPVGEWAGQVGWVQSSDVEPV